MRWTRSTAVLLAVGTAGVLARPVLAQELEPRAYAASPVGATFLVIAGTRSSGGVLLDPSVPVQDVDARLGAAAIGAGRTFPLFTRTALVLGLVPYARARATGRIEEETREVTRAGWGDARLKLSVNLVGGKALRPAEFAAAPRGTIVGVSLSAVLPTGQYFRDRLVNLGANRWAFKPEIGTAVPINRWTLDAYTGVWLFTANREFLPGQARRTQEPVLAVQGHVSYTIRARLWLSFDATWYAGGTTSVDGVPKADFQRNSRLGAAASFPLGRRQSLKAAYSAGATTRIGGDFRTISLGWQMTWLQ